MSRQAERESFSRIMETCPEANTAHTRLASAVDSAISDYHDAQKELRDKLRAALTEACEQIIELEGQVEDLTAERDQWMKIADDRENEVKSLRDKLDETLEVA